MTKKKKKVVYCIQCDTPITEGYAIQVGDGYIHEDPDGCIVEWIESEYTVEAVDDDFIEENGIEE
jgi:hypothetical protein